MILDAKAARRGLALAAHLRSLTTVEEMQAATEKAGVRGILGRLKRREADAFQAISSEIRRRIEERGEQILVYSFSEYLRAIEIELWMVAEMGCP